MLDFENIIEQFIDYCLTINEKKGSIELAFIERIKLLTTLCPNLPSNKDNPFPDLTLEEIEKARAIFKEATKYHKENLIKVYEFLYDVIGENNPSKKILISHSPDITKEFSVTIKYDIKEIILPVKRYNGDSLPENNINNIDQLPEFLFITIFAFFCQEKRRDDLLAKLSEKNKEIETISAEKKESENKLLAIIKTPVNLLNVLLTDKVKTLEKLDKSINKITNAIKKSTDNKRKSQLQRQLKEAKRVFDKCVNNFPDNFNFSVYEHYAIFGGFKLLTQNNYKPTEMFFIDILKALNFRNKNRSEISLIKQAFIKLTTQNFPCYMIRQSDSGEDKYDFYDGDEPIFKIREFGTLDLNIDLTDKEIVKKRLILSLENPALIYDLENFYMLINGNILSELREYKKVSEADLYFVEYLVKENHFKRKQTETTLSKLCEVMKKTNFLDKNKDIKDRDSKRRIKAIVLNLSSFMQTQNILSSYEIADNGEVVFKYTTNNERETLRLPVAESAG